MLNDRKTKIVATVGPASLQPGVLDAMIAAGMSVARINMSHGSIEDHATKIQAVREAALRASADVAILADLPGPKIRAGKFPDGGVSLVPGQTFRIYSSMEDSTAEEIHIDYQTLLTDVQAGNRIVLGDGAISLETIEVCDDHLLARVISGGVAQGSPGTHLAVEDMSLRTPTPTDFMLAARFADAVDYFAVSFVCHHTDLLTIKEEVAGRAGLVAKIETNSAMRDLENIVETADAVMVARGDLGLDCPVEEVPLLQKEIISLCNRLRTPVITATQMLESMISAPTPTRAEVSDVANAVLDGTDAVMLSGETAIGVDPANVVSTMARIAERAESIRVFRNAAPLDTTDVAVALAHAAVQISETKTADAIIAITEAGNTANAVASFRPHVPVLALSTDSSVVRRMALLSGVQPAEMPEFSSTDAMIASALATADTLDFTKPGQTVVLVSGAGDIIRYLQV